ncbi:MAG: hypothetical protein Q4A28_03465 [Brachymonas sp.]|nr:hypothetical protein [Brachymonas sp.]
MLKHIIKRSIQVLALLLLLGAVLAVITRKPLPDNSGRSASTSLSPDPASLLAARLLPQIEAHPGLSGVYPLREGRDAFLACLALTESAQHTLPIASP